MEGIAQPFAYYGYPRSTFPLHREDLDLWSINYLHQGKPKYLPSQTNLSKNRFRMWYGFRAKDNDRIIQYLKKAYQEEYAYCEQAFRHKNFFLNLQKLQEYFPDLKIFQYFSKILFYKQCYSRTRGFCHHRTCSFPLGL